MNKNGNIQTPPIPWYTVPGEGCWQDDVLDNDCHIVDLVKYQDHIVECVNSHDDLTAEVARLKAANAKIKKERDELFWEIVRLRSMANGTPDDAFGRLLTFADWWDANHPFSPDEGKILRKSWAKIVQLQMANDKMREALDKASDTMRLVIESAEDVMQPHLVQEICHCGLAIEKTIATEGGAK